MNIKLGLKIFSAAACLGVWGCMAVNNDGRSESRANALKFVNASSAPLAKLAAEGDEIDWDALGCPKLGKLFKDFQSLEDEDEIPQSFRDYLSCFGLSLTPTQEELEGIAEKFQNPTELLDCICGGTALSDAFNTQKWSTFSASTSSAAGASFNASNSSASGSAYNASNSNVSGGGFDASTSNAGGAGFSAE